MLQNLIEHADEEDEGSITFEITMLKGVNDKLSHAREIVDKIRKTACIRNSIGVNYNNEFAGWQPSMNRNSKFVLPFVCGLLLVGCSELWPSLDAEDPSAPWQVLRSSTMTPIAVATTGRARQRRTLAYMVVTCAQHCSVVSVRGRRAAPPLDLCMF